MNDFNENDPQLVADFVLRNLAEHQLFALSTIDENGDPWTVCLTMAADNQADILWVSLKEREHSKHLVERPRVSLCVFSKREGIGDFGFYAKATAHEITNKDELQQCVDTYYAKTGKTPSPVEDFLGDEPFRMYKARISEAWVNGDRYLKTKVDLEVLRNLA